VQPGSESSNRTGDFHEEHASGAGRVDQVVESLPRK
jgi:hypothetical protein